MTRDAFTCAFMKQQSWYMPNMNEAVTSETKVAVPAADSLPPLPKVNSYVGVWMAFAIAVGVGLVVLMGRGFVSWCPSVVASSSAGICGVVASNPPWLLVSGVLTAPAVLLTWYWRTLAKNAELSQKNHDITHRRSELDHHLRVFTAQRDDVATQQAQTTLARQDRLADVLERLDSKFASAEVKLGYTTLDGLPSVAQLRAAGLDPETQPELPYETMSKLEPLLRFYVFLNAMIELKQITLKNASASYRYWLGLASSVRGDDMVPQFEQLVRDYWPTLAEWLDEDRSKPSDEQFFARR